jgi:hypothetical protein
MAQFLGLKARHVIAQAEGLGNHPHKIFSALKGRNVARENEMLDWVPALQSGRIFCAALPRPALADPLQSGLSHSGLSALTLLVETNSPARTPVPLLSPPLPLPLLAVLICADEFSRATRTVGKIARRTF